jgi:hypothetical protein
MADMAVHLEQRVLPAVPIRHWICSLPWGLRALLGYDRKLTALVASAFASELDRSLKKRAKAALGLSTVADAHTGSVLAVQRTDSALRLNVHFHLLGLDGVYVRDKDSGRLVFHALGTPSRAEVAEVAARTAARIEKILRKGAAPSTRKCRTESRPSSTTRCRASPPATPPPRRASPSPETAPACLRCASSSPWIPKPLLATTPPIPSPRCAAS